MGCSRLRRMPAPATRRQPARDPIQPRTVPGPAQTLTTFDYEEDRHSSVVHVGGQAGSVYMNDEL